MSRIAYVNGRYRLHHHAMVHVEDRGYQFADGVYEVCEVKDGCLIDMTRHLDRLERSMSELSMRAPVQRSALQVIMREVVRRNRVRDGMVYVQVTRGVAKRDFLFPPDSVRPALVVTARAADPAAAEARAEAGIKVFTMPDNRWERVDIKSVALLPNVLAKENARQLGGREAWLVDREGYVTEGGSSNAWIVTVDGTLVTRPDVPGILSGITRRAVLDLASQENLCVEQRRFTVEEAKHAREAFITAATTLVMPVVEIDDAVIGNGRPGSIAQKLRASLHSVTERVLAA